MTHDELRRVIEEPAAVKVMRFEPPALVDRLVNEVVQMPGALPLLSFALSQMYLNYLNRNSDDRALTDADYEALEGACLALFGSGRTKLSMLWTAIIRLLRGGCWSEWCPWNPGNTHDVAFRGVNSRQPIRTSRHASMTF
jgi:hypothetical protein